MRKFKTGGTIIIDNKYKWVEGKGLLIKNNNFLEVNSNIFLSDLIKNDSDLFKTYILREKIVGHNNVIYINGNIADIDSIASLFNVCNKRISCYLSRMDKLNIIKKCTVSIQNFEQSYYLFNPIYANSCKEIGTDIYLTFKEEIDKYLSLDQRIDFKNMIVGSKFTLKEFDDIYKGKNININEFYYQDLFNKYAEKIIDGSKVVRRKHDNKNIPDSWVKIGDEYIPVEVKLNNFDKNALNQLLRYMNAYHCNRGIAVGRKLTTAISSNIMFINNDILDNMNNLKER